MRLIATFFISLVLLAADASAQCTLTFAEAPTLVNLRLGMSPAEVNSALNGAARVKVKKDGQYSYFKSYLKKGKAKGILTGARAFYVRFFDKRVYQIEIFYHNEFQSTDLESFVRSFSARTNFNFGNFKIENGYAKAECEGFTVAADTILNPHLELTDEGIKAILNNK